MPNNAYTVSQFNEYVKSLLQTDPMLSSVSVEGEVSSSKYYSSGHLYIDLKEEVTVRGRKKTEVLKVVMWASNVASLNFRVEPGQRILVRGGVGVFNSGYQVVARTITLAGTGLLYERFEQLKQELESRGLFDEMYKVPIPKFALNIGVVTSRSGAVIHDIQNVAKRRNPYARIFLRPCIVQGSEAPDSIVDAIKYLDTLGLDVIIVGRGGGSIEDLWCFNDEKVAMAIFECNTPVISAVGHEVDFTIADFVSDRRAPTPSAAAELAVFEYEAFLNQLQYCSDTMLSLLSRKIENKKVALNQISDYMSNTLNNQLNLKKQYIKHLSDQLQTLNPKTKLESKKTLLVQIDKRLKDAMTSKLSRTKNRFNVLSEKLDGLSPIKKMVNGYGYLKSDKGAVGSVEDVSINDNITITINDGCIDTVVQNITKGDYHG